MSVISFLITWKKRYLSTNHSDLMVYIKNIQSLMILNEIDQKSANLHLTVRNFITY